MKGKVMKKWQKEAKEKEQQRTQNPVKQPVTKDSIYVARVKNNGKWGYIDQNGKMLVHYSYQYAEDYSEAGFRAQRAADGEWLVLVWRDGVFLEYSVPGMLIGPFRHGIAKIGGTYKTEQYQDGYIGNMPCVEYVPCYFHGYISSSGKLLSDFNYYSRDRYHQKGITESLELSDSEIGDGQLIKVIDAEPGRFVPDPRYRFEGLMDFEGKLVLPCNWRFGTNHSFREGLIYAEGYRGLSTGKKGFINAGGEVVLPKKWNWVEAGDFHDGLAKIVVRSLIPGSAVCFINKQGKQVGGSWENATDFSDGYAWVKSGRAQKGGTWSRIDRAGNLSCGWWEDAKGYCEGRAAVKRNGLWGFVDLNGTLVTPCQWEDVRNYSEGRAGVMRNGRWGFIDRNGVLVAPCQWEWVWDYSDGYAEVEQNRLWGFVDQSGNLVTPFEYANTWAVRKGRALIRKQDEEPHYIYIQTLPADNNSMEADSVGLWPVKQNGLYGFADENGKLVIPCQWEDVGPFRKLPSRD